MSIAREKATGLVRRLVDEGHVAYFAGGCVRDFLLGGDPKDYDIATDATPDQIESYFPHTHAVGAHFGVILIRETGHEYEIATFRKEAGYSDGRRPDAVTFTDAEEDVH